MADWKTTKIKYNGEYWNGLTYSPQDLCDETEGTLVLRSSNIKDGKITLDDNVYVKCPIESKALIKKNDILICSRNGSKELIGKNAIYTKNEKVAFGAFMMIYRCNNPRYMYYVLNSNIFKENIGLFSTSTVNQLTGSVFGNIKFPLPDNKIQNRIADFLDSKCAKIDSLKNDIEKQIETLEQYKKSVITEVVTKGINPDEKMKDSGVEWIGEIPEGWEKIRLKYLCAITNGDEDTQNADPDGDYLFYVRSPKIERCNRYSFNGEGILVAGDGAGAGRIFHHAYGKYAVHQRVYILHDFKCNTNFLHYYLSNTFPNEMDRGSAQSTVPSMRLPMLQNFQIFLPNSNIQKQIADYLDSKCSSIDNIIKSKKQQLEKLEEYKKSLIFEYVTGKKQVEE